MHSFYNLVYVKLVPILSVLVCVEVASFLLLYRRRSSFSGQNLLLSGIMCFLLVAILNCIGSFGLFDSVIVRDSVEYFAQHPLIFWGKTPVFLFGCLLSGIGVFRLYVRIKEV